MKSKNLIVLSLLATLLVSTAFASLANAADDVPSSIEPFMPTIVNPPDAAQASIAEPANPDSAVSSDDLTNCNSLQGDNSASGDCDAQIPVEANIVYAKSDAGFDNLWVILGLMGVCSLGLGSVVGVVLHRRVHLGN